jgi:DNA-nicking Smr family endonuclease
MSDDLDDNDSELFRASMINVKPLTNTHRVRPTPKKRPPKLLKQPKELLRAEIELNTDISVPLVDANETLYFKQPGVQVRQMRELQMGKPPCQATLDLHGMTLNNAEAELGQFLERCRARNFRVVAVVHGKGDILKNMVYKFLRQYVYAIAFCSAPPKLGGLGATLVLLKKD